MLGIGSSRPGAGLRLVGAATLAVVAVLVASATLAASAGASTVLQYRGYRIDVPSSWPVYRLGPGSPVCVRFDRHAVYLGVPSAAERCPAHAVGRTEAILVEPLTARVTADRAAALAGGAA